MWLLLKYFRFSRPSSAKMKFCNISFVLLVILSVAAAMALNVNPEGAGKVSHQNVACRGQGNRGPWRGGGGGAGGGTGGTGDMGGMGTGGGGGTGTGGTGTGGTGTGGAGAAGEMMNQLMRMAQNVMG